MEWTVQLHKKDLCPFFVSTKPQWSILSLHLSVFFEWLKMHLLTSLVFFSTLLPLRYGHFFLEWIFFAPHSCGVFMWFHLASKWDVAPCFFCILFGRSFTSTLLWEAKWQRASFIIESLLLNPDVGPCVKAELRQKNKVWSIVLDRGIRTGSCLLSISRWFALTEPLHCSQTIHCQSGNI